jgi:hypothetical protein
MMRRALPFLLALAACSVARGAGWRAVALPARLLPRPDRIQRVRALPTVPLVPDGDQVSVRAVDDETLGWPAGEHELQTRGGGR